MTASPVTAVVPVKDLAHAKTRLALPGAERRLLAMAFALDTVGAVLAAHRVDRVVVVTSDAAAAAALLALEPQRVRVVADGGIGLVGAVRRGVLAARASGPGTSVCVVPADLPSLRADDVDRVLDAAALRGAYVTDRAGTGTTLLVLPAEEAVTVRYGPGSAGRHAAAGLLALTDVPRRARHDIDTLADLHLALRLGAGPATTEVSSGLGLVRSDRREAG